VDRAVHWVTPHFAGYGEFRGNLIPDYPAGSRGTLNPTAFGPAHACSLYLPGIIQSIVVLGHRHAKVSIERRNIEDRRARLSLFD